MRFAILIFTVISSLSALSGCLVPPNRLEARVVDSKELALVSRITKARAYVNESRLELAEREYRHALVMAPRLPSLYNDLGIVLSSQGRLREAAENYLKALSIDSSNLISRENLARVWFEMGRHHDAIKLYEKILEENARRRYVESNSGRELEVLSGAVLSAIYRNISLAHRELGNWGEALCYSRLALASDYDLYQMTQHSRLLLSFDHLPQAAEFLERLVLEQRGDILPDLMLDYGVSLYSMENKSLSKQALSKALVSSGLVGDGRRDTKLVLLLASRDSGQSVQQSVPDDVVSDTAKDLIKEFPELCGESRLQFRGYWPHSVRGEMSELVFELCNNESQSFASTR